MENDERDAEISALKLLILQKDDKISEQAKEIDKLKRQVRNHTKKRKLDVNEDEMNDPANIPSNRLKTALYTSYVKMSDDEKRKIESNIKRYVVAGSMHWARIWSNY